MQLGSVHGRQAPCPLSLSGVQQRAQRLRPRPAQPLRLAGGRQGKPRRGLPQLTRAETGFGLTRQAGREWLQSLLSRFGPMNDKASNAYVLDFEKPLVELDNRIKEVGCPDHRPGRQRRAVAAQRARRWRSAGPPGAGIASRMMAGRACIAANAPLPAARRCGRWRRTTAWTCPGRLGSWSSGHCRRAASPRSGPAESQRVGAGRGALAATRPRCGLCACVALLWRQSALRLATPPDRAVRRAAAAAQGHVRAPDGHAAAASRATRQPAHVPGHCAQHHGQVCGAARRPRRPGRPGHRLRPGLHRRHLLHAHRPPEGPQHEGAQRPRLPVASASQCGVVRGVGASLAPESHQARC